LQVNPFTKTNVRTAVISLLMIAFVTRTTVGKRLIALGS